MILKPFSHQAEMDYKAFLRQNYYVLLKENIIKKLNLKGINKISKENDDSFIELNESQIISRKFEDQILSPDLISEAEIPVISEIAKEKLEKNEDSKVKEISFLTLGSSFPSEMFDIVWVLEMASQEIKSGLEVIKDSIIFSEKSDNFEKCTENFKIYKNYLENPSDYKLLKSAKEGFEKCIEDYKGNPFPHFYLGLIYHRPTNIFDLDKSLNEFIEAKKYADEIENHYFSAICGFIISWLYYVNNDLDKAIECSLGAIENEFMNLPEIYFNIAKYYAAKKDSENAIKYLDEAIRRFDHLYAIKADIDEDFSLIKPELLKYFTNLKEEERTKVTNALNEMGISFVDSKDQQEKTVEETPT